MTQPAGAPKAITTFKPGENQDEKFAICIYGASGFGKTSLVGTMPGRGLVIDTPNLEGRTHVLADKADRIDITTVPDWNAIDAVYWHLMKNKHDYQWVAIDSITGMTEYAKLKVVKERSLAADPHTLTEREWGSIGSLMGDMVGKFKKLPLHIIWVAQERHYDRVNKLGPNTTPASWNMINPPLILCGRMEAGTTDQGKLERRLRVGPSDMYYTKATARVGVDMPALIRNPNLGQILGYMLGKKLKDGTPYPRPDEVQETMFVLG